MEPLLLPRRRLAEARRQIAKLAPSSIAPFTAASVLDFSDIDACAFWPFATPAPRRCRTHRCPPSPR